MNNALSTTKKEDLDRLSAMLLQRGGTNEKQLELKRREVGALNVALEAMAVKLQDENTSPEEHAKTYTTASITGMLALSKGIELLVDCCTSRSKVKVKNKKTGKIETGYVRFGVGDVAEKIALMLGSDEGMVTQLETLCEMTNEIGKKQNAFLDQNGVPDPAKYDYEEESKDEKIVEDNEAATDEELEQAEAAVKAKHGKSTK
jgi:hypothetical protein